MRKLHPRRAIRKCREALTAFIKYYCIPDKIYLSLKYRMEHGKKLNLKNPQTIDEKIQWIKLYDRKPEYHIMIDKIASRDFIADRLGTTKYSIPLYGSWNHFDDIDFSLLPDQFVLKCNHDSASWIICRDKRALNLQKAKEKLERALGQNYYHYSNKQWGYDGIKPRILAEMLLNTEMIEYQVFCNNGNPVFILARTDLGDSSHGRNGYNVCYSLEWEKKEYRVQSYPDIQLRKPQFLEKMIEIAGILSKNTLHLRVDFFETSEALFIGELTFYSNGGNFHNFSEEGRKILSETLHLPIQKHSAR